MGNLRGAYLAFAHDRPADWDFLRAWQPNVVRLMVQGSHSDPNSVDVNRIRRVYEWSGGAQILLRCWDVDDRNGEAHAAMAAEPTKEAERQVDWWYSVIRRAADVGVPRDRLIAGLINEPNPHQHGAAILEFTDAAIHYAAPVDIRLGVYCFSVGNPAKAGEAQFDWPFFARLEPNIVGGRHVVILHEYMQPEGMYAVWTDAQGNERSDYGNLIGRHLYSGLTRADIIIGEWGIDGLLFNRHPHPQYGNNGWLSFRDTWGPERYADEYVECIRQAAPNVIGICPFISDAPSHQWDSFEVQTAYGALLSRKELCERETVPAPDGQHTTHLPQVGSGPQTPTAETPTPQPEAPTDNWQRTKDFILAREGGYQANPEDKGNWTGGAIGVGELKGTKYGISAASYPDLDIINLSLTEAIAIYRRDYWQASGADQMPWPQCLLVMDTAVLHGVGTARHWLAEVGPDPYLFAAKRLRVYTQSQHWHAFGAGWVNRVALLLEACAA